jgi:MoxR-like ATPase
VALRDLTDRSAVLQAISEFREIGEDRFLEKYGFERSRRFEIAYEGETFPSKAILGAAHGFQFPEVGPLTPAEFSGGRMTVDKARQLGFEVVETDAPDDLALGPRRFMELFAEARETRFGHDHPAVDALRGCAKVVEDLLPESLAGAKVRPSVGQGNWAGVPWIAVLHPRETTTTQRGIYPVLLFREDLSAVEVTIAQGVTELNQTIGRRRAYVELDHRSERLRPKLGALDELGFALDKAFDLGASQLARDYVASTVAHRRFTSESLLAAQVTDAVTAVLEAYAQLVVSGELDAAKEAGDDGGSGHVTPDAGRPPTPAQVTAAARAFAEAVELSGLRLSRDLVSSFFAAMLSKPFVIITGQSGSGKTQLAMRFGEWVGSDPEGRARSLVVPVRPDWTGPEYLFGYPDALRSAPGKEVWAVPDALEFMLRAAEEPDEPYLLVLDEMNLAHVERYFADFLSGVESRRPILPALTHADGEWVAVEGVSRLQLPRNLIVIGTVTVDETTYLFSPKVLDRAFTFEFRTAATDLDPALRRPTPVDEGPVAHRQTLVRAVVDDNWQHTNANPSVDELAEHLVLLHSLLAQSGHEFGHRVLYEALRYAAFLHATGVQDRWSVLDWIMLTKLLPKVHGTRARVETELREMRSFAAEEDTRTSSARMPLSVDKLDRMIGVLIEAQFVSFTE